MKIKAQASGLNAALLIAIIAALMLTYVIFLPTSVKEEIFKNATSTIGTDDSKKEPDVLLLEHPGRLEHITEGTIEHAMPAVNLYAKTEATVVKASDAIYVRRSIFSKDPKIMDFNIDDLSTVSNLVLNFNVKKAKGSLVVKINGKEVYSGFITVGNAPPIELLDEYLAEGKNVLEFTLSSVGFKFWSANEYNLENVRVIGDVTDMTTLSSKVVFLVSDTEKINIDKVKLRFLPECEQRETGKLDVLINSDTIFSAVPDCGVLRPLEFNPDFLASGENTLEFRTSRGRYLIEQINVKSELKEQPSYTYFFELSRKRFNKVQEGKADVNATFTFTDDEEFKEADLFINGRKSGITRTRKAEYMRNINIYVEEGSNSFKIVPKTTIEIKDLEIRYKEK